jgi:hypothetical protein
MMKMLAEYSERISEEIGKRSEVKVVKMQESADTALADEDGSAGVLLVGINESVISG